RRAKDQIARDEQQVVVGRAVLVRIAAHEQRVRLAGLRDVIQTEGVAYRSGDQVVGRGDVVAILDLEGRGGDLRVEDVAAVDEAELPVGAGRARVAFAHRLGDVVRIRRAGGRAA